MKGRFFILGTCVASGVMAFLWAECFSKSVNGENVQDRFGTALARLPDVEGDGASEIVVGAPGFFGTAGAQSGKIYVYSSARQGVRWSREGTRAGGGFGTSVASMGDVNLDSFADILAGEPADGVRQNARAGVYSGLDGAPLWSWRGPTGDTLFGTAVAGCGDIDGDGYPDAAIGAPALNPGGVAQVTVFSGGTGVLLRRWNKYSSITFGGALACPGDVDGDGTPDLLVGEWLRPGDNRGVVYLFSGRSDSLPPLRTWEGEVFAWFGKSVSSLDVDGNGVGDVVLVGAPLTDGSAGLDSGKVFAFSLATGKPLGDWEGAGAVDRFGSCVAGMHLRPGKSEMAVGAPGWNSGTGASYVFAAAGGGFLARLEGTTTSSFGHSLCDMGDLHGNFLGDLLAGSPTASASRGRMTLFFCR